MSPVSREEEPGDRPDVEISARASADEVTFHRVPDVRTTFDGDGESTVEGGRENLPHGVDPGTTHRRIRARYRAVSRADPRQDPPDREYDTLPTAERRDGGRGSVPGPPGPTHEGGAGTVPAPPLGSCACAPHSVRSALSCSRSFSWRSASS